MGGRGTKSGADNNQQTMLTYMHREKVKEICNNADIIRDSLIGMDNINNRIPKIYKRCYCCGKFVIPVDSLRHKCPICGWIDDEFQNTHIYSIEGQNEICLEEAKKLYQQKIKADNKIIMNKVDC